MPLETEQVAPREEETQKNEEETQKNEEEIVCPLKSPKSPQAEATEDFLVNEIKSYENDVVETIGANETPSEAPIILETPSEAPVILETPSEAPIILETSSEAPIILETSSESPIAPTTPTNSDEESVNEPEPPQIVDFNEKEPVSDEVIEELVVELNGHRVEEEPKVEEIKLLSNGQMIEEVIGNGEEKPKALNGTIASELPDYKLPDVVEVKKNFEFVAPSGNNLGHVPPKKGVLSTTIDSQGVKRAYQDVRNDGSDTQWAIFKFEGPTIVASATGGDFDEFKKHFGEDDRAFAYIRVQTGDEMSRRAKFLFFTWVGPNVSVLKRAKMSTDKALIKDIVSNFAVELQTENQTDITLQNFETELDKASGAHYGTGIRS